jgi:hypothetical protein
MRTVVAIYRGVEIYHSKTILCLKDVIRPNQAFFEAKVKGWLLIGSLESVRKEIDNLLGPDWPEPDEPQPESLTA